MTTENALQKFVSANNWSAFLKHPLVNIVKIEHFAENIHIKVGKHEFDLIAVDFEPGTDALYRVSTFDSRFKTSQSLTQQQCIDHIMSILFDEWMQLVSIFDATQGVKHMHASHMFDAAQSFEVKKELARQQHVVDAQHSNDICEAELQQAIEQRRAADRARYAAKKLSKQTSTKQSKAVKQAQQTSKVCSTVTAIKDTIEQSKQHLHIKSSSMSRDMKRLYQQQVIFKCVGIDGFKQFEVAEVMGVTQATVSNKITCLWELYMKSFQKFVEFVESCPKDWQLDVAKACEVLKQMRNRH